MHKSVEVSAPSNIALIKYMGKTDTVGNKPTNTSFSYTLNNLKTYVRLTEVPQATEDSWGALVREDLRPIELSEKGKSKYLNFFADLKKEFKLKSFYKIESANNFPSDCGLASSASSYAALTIAAHEMYLKNDQRSLVYRPKELARLSQRGSGSSCRSFFTPWAMWHEAGAEQTMLPYENLRHMVVLCDESVKAVSSSEAHVRVLSSDLFKGRVERAHDRLQNMLAALRSKDWVAACQISWNEFWDMHVLFHTAKPAFMYMNWKSMNALTVLNEMRQHYPEVMVTMDAGSNIHILLRAEDNELYQQIEESFVRKFNLWTDSGYKKKME